ncbi:MAG TPA: sialate O-acetylesterase [Flavisolibacter sp.]|jgi:sialate O-acetylesterase|nr:sialate O-acetylesterase [Flavisolibacter sp.]
MIRTFLFYCFFSAIALTAFADVRLPAIIGNHMVLQQSANVTLWGWCEPGEKISIKAGWDTTTYATTGTSGAAWKLSLPTPKAGGPYTITIKGNNTIIIDDVLVGEVWLCSGQSNMEMNMGWGLPYEKEAAEATGKNIRFFHVPRTTATYPQDDVKARWVVCTPEEMKKFSAVGYFFGKDISEKLNVPVGLIGSSWGGTPAEVWTPDAVVLQDEVLKMAAGKLKPSNGWPINPGATYNAMIYPLQNFSIAGSIWYQGESNTGTWDTYQPLLTKMIDAWQKGFQKDFPFYLVQIAPYAGYGDFPSSALLREQQTKIVNYPNTGMVVIHDLVDNINDIHPKMKKEVGQRLAALALTKTYGVGGLSADYPQYDSMAIEKDKIRITFANAEGGLMAKSGEPTAFYIAGEDQVFYPAKAVIKGSSVVVSSKEVKKPVAVRFGFSNAAMPNLFSKKGLPVNIFRTDNWEISADAAKK